MSSRLLCPTISLGVLSTWFYAAWGSDSGMSAGVPPQAPIQYVVLRSSIVTPLAGLHAESNG